MNQGFIVCASVLVAGFALKHTETKERNMRSCSAEDRFDADIVKGFFR